MQQAVLQRLADRCGAPVAWVSARTLASGLTTLLQDTEDITRVVRTIRDHPWAIAGTGRFDTLVTTALKGTGFMR